ncbi:MAG: winged helix-turn-helix domain-containing protein [Brevinema sp.]
MTNKLMIFHVLAINCTHFDYKKLADIGILYQHHVSFSSLANPISSKHFFHVFLITQKHNNYLEVIQKARLEFPNAIFVLLIEEYSNITSILQTKELFFYIDLKNKDTINYTLHQLWQWILILEHQKFHLNNENNTVAIAEGFLSLSEESYQRKDKVYKLTRKQMDLLKILLEHRGESVSRFTLIQRIWPIEQKIVTDRVIDTNIVALRKMFGDQGRNPKYLQTIFGQGYRLNLE